MPDPKDRRQSERFPVTPQTTCSYGALLKDLGPTRIKNVSMEGIGLILSQKVEVGDLLAVNVANPSRNFQKVLVVKVVHVTPQAGGSCVVGGTFETPLTYQEFTALIM